MRQPTPRLLQSTTPWELSVLDEIISHIEAHRAFDHAEASAKAQTLAFIERIPIAFIDHAYKVI